MNKTIKKIIYYSAGSLILSLGIALSIKSNLGAGAYDALNSNLSHLLNISVGQAMYISVLIIYIINMLIKPRWIYIFGLFLSLIVGFEIDLWSRILPEFNLFILKLLYFLMSIIFLPLGVAFIIKSKLPLGPMDNLLVILVEKTKRSVTLVKTLIESSYAVIALIYGILAGIGIGALSIGTIVITLTIGPLIGFFLKYVKNIEPK